MNDPILTKSPVILVCYFLLLDACQGNGKFVPLVWGKPWGILDMNLDMSASSCGSMEWIRPRKVLGIQCALLPLVMSLPRSVLPSSQPLSLPHSAHCSPIPPNQTVNYGYS